MVRMFTIRKLDRWFVTLFYPHDSWPILESLSRWGSRPVWRRRSHAQDLWIAAASRSWPRTTRECCLAYRKIAILLASKGHGDLDSLSKCQVVDGTFQEKLSCRTVDFEDARTEVGATFGTKVQGRLELLMTSQLTQSAWLVLNVNEVSCLRTTCYTEMLLNIFEIIRCIKSFKNIVKNAPVARLDLWGRWTTRLPWGEAGIVNKERKVICQICQ